LNQMEKNKEKVKGKFDHKVRDKIFKEGYLVLLWDNRKEKMGMHKKINSLWTRPYNIVDEESLNSFNLATLGGEKLKIIMNSIHLKLYFQDET
jgi:hypothetical protein